MCTCLCPFMCFQGPEKARGLGSPETEVVTHLVWVLGTKSRSLGKVVCVLKPTSNLQPLSIYSNQGPLWTPRDLATFCLCVVQLEKKESGIHNSH